jgi:hypothetical protein
VWNQREPGEGLGCVGGDTCTQAADLSTPPPLMPPPPDANSVGGNGVAEAGHRRLCGAYLYSNGRSGEPSTRSAPDS